MLSTHRVEVTRVALHPHPNAELLSIATLAALPGYQVVVRTADWHDGQLGAYIPPDSLVPVARPEFSFLATRTKPGETQYRIRVVKLRGTYSQGLLIAAPGGANEGDDVAAQLGVEHYDPPEPGGPTRGATRADPFGGRVPIYDVDSFRRYGLDAFTPGELVVVTEKLHGTNARYTFYEEEVWCGSHKQWKIPTGDCLWWEVLQRYPGITHLCRSYPGAVVYGEIYGLQKNMRYGLTGGIPPAFAGFDVLLDGRWLDAIETPGFLAAFRIPSVPILTVLPFHFRTLLDYAEGESAVGTAPAGHLREGIVVKPWRRERWVPSCGRVNLKIVANRFLEQTR